MQSRLHWSARGLAVATFACVPVLGGGVAHAESALAAGQAGDPSTLLAAPVATGTIALGALGMAVGFLRKRRRLPEQAPVEAPASAAELSGELSGDGEPEMAPTVAPRTGDTEVPRPRAEPELPVRTPRS